jgi:hypothetical protein
MSSISSAAYYSAVPNWLEDAFTSIQNEKKNNGGLMGMLRNSGGDGSIKSYLKRSVNNANAFALISQNGTSNAVSLITQLAAQNMERENEKQMKKVMADLEASHNRVKEKNVLDSVIYFNDGSTIDTNSNIRTTPDGTQYDTITGALYVDPTSIVQMANGAYLDTKNNSLTLPDGTRIDTVTGLKIAVTA